MIFHFLAGAVLGTQCSGHVGQILNFNICTDRPTYWRWSRLYLYALVLPSIITLLIMYSAFEQVFVYERSARYVWFTE